MLLIDDLLFAPLSGFKFIMRTLIKTAEEEWTNDAPLKEELLHLQIRLEGGEITEDEYVELEREILVRLRQIQRHKMELAGVDPDSMEGEARVFGQGNMPTLEVSAPDDFVDHE
ncbi:gas vesicle protein GvpG [Candidatus Korobacter versatilis]|nr:gas vesicle protein GvpG [Candidatus Koribacter versatilis]